MSLRELRSWRRVRVSLVRETSDEPYRLPPAVRQAKDVAELVRAFLRDDPRETFVAVYLDTRHRVIAVHACHIGDAGVCPVTPRGVFGPALSLSASALVVAHNHPSGDPTPSRDDARLTDRLRQAGELLGIEVIDHLVLGERTFYSFAEERVLDPSAPPS